MRLTGSQRDTKPVPDMAFESKLPNTGTTIFTVMSALAAQHDAINLSQGFPDFDCDKDLKDLVAHYMNEGYNQYAPMPGFAGLRQMLATKISTLYGARLDPDLNITITAGATQAIFTAIATIVQPGDEVIIFDPAYDCYSPGIKVFGGRPVPVNLVGPDFRIDWDQVESRITDRTVAVIINSPHNPLGVILESEDLQALERLANKHGLYVISDEVYEHIVFDGKEHESVLKYPGLADRTFSTYSFGKVFHNTGWKLGYCVAPEHLTSEFRKVHQFNVFSVNHPPQRALADYLQDATRYLQLPEFFQAKRDFFVNAMSGTRFKMLRSAGSYFVLADYSAISDEDDMAFARWLTEEHQVATIPLSPFYTTPPPNQRLVRFCFAKSQEVLAEAAARLAVV